MKLSCELIRDAIGSPLQGWKPFGAWSHPGASEDETYLLDAETRVVRRPAKKGDRAFTPEEGLDTLRKLLSNPGSVVRLVGLSGVGKTRFVQALFDARIGLGSLDPASVVYTNLANNPQSLLRIAEACSLVYSFQGALADEASEMEVLGTLVGATSQQVYSAVSDLLVRDLAQRRGVWRAILPQAIANRLAASAMRKIPGSSIRALYAEGTPKRLTISFSRRLAYLHQSPEAVDLVNEWLAPHGWLGNPWDLNTFGRTLFSNVLPAAPEAGLAAIERNTPTVDPSLPWENCTHLPRLLRSLAYDSSLFERSVAMLAKLALHAEERTAEEAAKVHGHLFQLYGWLNRFWTSR